ncbi:MAG TPA: nuclear transport factor 2 family protein [Thermoanaerobaculia bacterium]|nr:nuclear transport factor 2 family protein [Thermoanaerobaculia bacterium]
MKVIPTLAGILLAAAAAAQTHVDVKTISPRPEDVATIDGMVKAYYEVVSGPAGQPRDWARDRTLYIKDLRFVAVDVDKLGQLAPRITSHQEYVDASDRMSKDGFFEKEIHRVTERFGPIAHVWSTYESRRTENGPVIMRGINSIELFWDGKRWWIANAIWTDETKDNPIPKEYLPAGK